MSGQDLDPRVCALLDHAAEQVEADGEGAVLDDGVLDAYCDPWPARPEQRWDAEQDLILALVAKRDLEHGDHPFVVLGERAPANPAEALDVAADDVAAALRRLITGR